MGDSWKGLNSTSDIPECVLDNVRRITCGKNIIDFGAGNYKKDHVDFCANRETRWDKNGVVYCTQENSFESLSEIVTNNRGNFIFVFFRVISVLIEEEIFELKRLLLSLVDRIEYIVVYDYLYNTNRADEYEYIENSIGTVAKVSVEWWDSHFYHYTADQISKIVPGRISLQESVSVPAVNRIDSGKLLIYEIE